MKLKDIFSTVIQEGIKTDSRKKEQVQRYLRQQKKYYNRLRPGLKKFFDTDSLKNPFSDTRILNGDRDAKVKRVMVGIDIGVEEILLADRLSQNGKRIDLVVSHHPEGHAWAGLYEVMRLQTDIFVNLGVDQKVAEDLMKKRIGQVERRVHSSNHAKSVDAARLLDMPFLCCHTPADNHVALYLQKTVDKNKPATLGKLIDLLLKEPEYKEAALNKAGPKLLCGKEKDKAGKIFVDMTGGTSGAKEVFARLSQTGINTIIGMHFSEEHFKKIKSEYINILIAGHMASDSLGMNLLFDKIEKKEKLDIVECSGFRRYRR